jgi:hypothetical protein
MWDHAAHVLQGDKEVILMAMLGAAMKSRFGSRYLDNSQHKSLTSLLESHPSGLFDIHTSTGVSGAMRILQF